MSAPYVYVATFPEPFAYFESCVAPPIPYGALSHAFVLIVSVQALPPVVNDQLSELQPRTHPMNPVETSGPSPGRFERRSMVSCAHVPVPPSPYVVLPVAPC